MSGLPSFLSVDSLYGGVRLIIKNDATATIVGLSFSEARAMIAAMKRELARAKSDRGELRFRKPVSAKTRKSRTGVTR